MKIRGHITKTRDGKWYTPVATLEIPGKEKQYFKGGKHALLCNARDEMRMLKHYTKLKASVEQDAVAKVPMMTPKAHGLWARFKAMLFGSSGRVL